MALEIEIGESEWKCEEYIFLQTDIGEANNSILLYYFKSIDMSYTSTVGMQYKSGQEEVEIMGVQESGQSFD